MYINLRFILALMALANPVHSFAQEKPSQEYLETCMAFESTMNEVKQSDVCQSVVNTIIQSGVADIVEKAQKMAKDACIYRDEESDECAENHYVEFSVVIDNLVLRLCEFNGFNEVVDGSLYSSLSGIVYRDGNIVSRCDRKQLDQGYPFLEMDPVTQENEYSGENHILLFANLDSILNDYKPKLYEHYLAKVDFSNPDNKDAILDLLALSANIENGEAYSLVLDKLQVFDNPDDYYNQPLGISISAGQTAGAQKLLAKNVSAKGAVSSDESYLYVAAEKGDLELVKQLLAKGANVNGLEFGVNTYTYGLPLANALANKHFEIVEELLASGALVATSADFDPYKTVMTAAMQSGHLEFFDRLHAQGASIPEELEDNMHLILQGGNSRILKRLFELGVSAEPKDQNRILSHYLNSLKEKNVAAVDMLQVSLNNGFSIAGKDDGGFSYTQRALGLFSRSYISNKSFNADVDDAHKRYVKLVIDEVQKNNPSTLTQTIKNQTLLMAAASNGVVDIVELLLKAGVDKTIINREKTALDMAREGRKRLAKKKDSPAQLVEEFEQVIALLEADQRVKP